MRGPGLLTPRGFKVKDPWGEKQVVEPLLDEGLELPPQQQWTTYRWVLGVILVLVQVTTNIASAELMQKQEQTVAQFDSPYFSVWFNHSFSGGLSLVIGMIMIAINNRAAKRAGQSTRTILEVLGDEAGLFSWTRTLRVSLWLVVLYKYNVFWAVSHSLFST